MPITNMKAIQTVTVGAGGASSIDFTSIPQTYTDLIIKFSTRTDGGGTAVAARLNSDSGSNYPWRMLEGSGVSAYSSSGTDTALRVGSSTGTPETASTFSNCEAYIPNYTGSNYKSASSDAVTETNATVAYISPRAAIWNNTSAITSIVLINTNGTNFVQYSTATLYGVSNTIASGAKAYGGTVTEDSTYFYHTFLSSGTFTPTQSITGDILVIAGGGSGASSQSVGEGGGGGAGGLVYSASQSLGSGTSYAVTVGAGGAYGNPDGGNNGSNSNVTGSGISLTAAVGGGKGGDYNVNGFSGGSGGGAGQNATTGGSPTSSQGNAGGSPGNTTVSLLCGSGGGGFGSAGTIPTQVGGAGNYVNAGNGGAGTSSYSAWGSATSTGQNVSGTYWYAGGGGGAPHPSQSTNLSFGVGGNGGGGAAAWTNTAIAPFRVGVSGLANTGGGGGGGNAGNGLPGFAGNGGSGVVIIRYAK